MGKKIFVACDPELLVKDSNGKPHHAIDHVKGDKWNPIPVVDGTIQTDNVSLEFTIEPADNVEDFSNRIDRVIAQGLEMLPRGYTLHNTPSHSFTDIEEFPESVWEFGCDPDFNAMTGERNPRPQAADTTLRSFGGHVHIDIPVEVTEESQRAVVLACDCLLGLWSVTVDKDKMRRKLYGNAGSYRPKPFGVEYRTLSNFWVLTKTNREIVFNLAVKASEVNNFEKLQKFLGGVRIEEVHNIINKGQVKKARELFNRFTNGN